MGSHIQEMCICQLRTAVESTREEWRLRKRESLAVTSITEKLHWDMEAKNKNMTSATRYGGHRK